MPRAARREPNGRREPLLDGGGPAVGHAGEVEPLDGAPAHQAPVGARVELEGFGGPRGEKPRPARVDCWWRRASDKQGSAMPFQPRAAPRRTRACPGMYSN